MAIVYEFVNDIAASKNIPNDCFSFFEQSMHVAICAEADINAMFESVGIEELAVYENTGSVMVYEGSKLENLKENAAKIFRNMWSNIKAAYEKILDFFENRRKESVKSLTSLTVADLEYVKDGVKLGQVNEFDINWLDECVDKCNKLRVEVVVKFGQQRKAVAGSESSGKEEFDALKKEFDEKIVPTISSTNAKSMATAKKVMMDKVKGEKKDLTKEWIRSNFNMLVDVVTKGSTKRDIQKSYKEEKVRFDQILKDIKSSKNDDYWKGAQQEVMVLADICKAMHSVHSIKMDACKVRYNQYKNILVKVAAAKVKSQVKEKMPKKKEKVEESFTPATSQVDLIEAAFQW